MLRFESVTAVPLKPGGGNFRQRKSSARIALGEPITAWSPFRRSSKKQSCAGVNRPGTRIREPSFFRPKSEATSRAEAHDPLQLAAAIPDC